MDDWEAVVEFGRAKEAWLRQFLPLANGIPSHDTFGRVFSLIDLAAFEAAFFEWATQAHIGGDGLSQLALDGKAARRSHRGQAGSALHLLHAWLGVKNERLRAAYDDNFRASVLQIAPISYCDCPGIIRADDA